MKNEPKGLHEWLLRWSNKSETWKKNWGSGDITLKGFGAKSVRHDGCNFENSWVQV